MSDASSKPTDHRAQKRTAQQDEVNDNGDEWPTVDPPTQIVVVVRDTTAEKSAAITGELGVPTPNHGRWVCPESPGVFNTTTTENVKP
jgi:hypothetical protein